MTVRISEIPFPVTEDAMRMHLKIDHGEYVGDVKQMVGLVECHESSHSDEHPSGHVIPHTHSDPLDSSPEEPWDW
jgi:hypothetical protein